MDTPALSPDARRALAGLADDLGRVFESRLLTVAAYGLHAQARGAVHAIAIVERLDFADLTRCAPLVPGWQRAGLAVPLVLEQEEFLRTLDVFPVEYGDIIANHELIAGTDILLGARVPPDDLRRACELSAKSHLIHLREGFLEAAGNPQAIAGLIAASADPFRALLGTIARLAGEDAADPTAAAERQIGIPSSLVREVLAAAGGHASAIAEPSALLSRYIDAAERVWEYVDTWRAGA